ncbi:SMC family ATPase [Geobacter pelophilus]|uniref:SMC family ATPase n=1 Tax=Geoanaerobacter pelophilus TaxID=60036 RepID=A0AAW4L3U1_9BACT|nr:SMC family ATPase [Geoanaerobacter pelophilus]MBT0664485.1 SMC family ATPase [Geoanaerobacter pelophilus]
MQILSIQLKNIKSHRDTQLCFSAGINVLSGPNGAGKSTIFEAIGYALFGVDARDFVSNVDRFLSIGAKRGEIVVTFRTDDDTTWQVSRTVGTPSKWLLAKERDGAFEVEEHARIEETEARIAELLGLNNGRPLAEQFKLVIGPFQNDFLGPFVIKQPTKRQEAFDEILGIDAWRKTYKGTSSLLSALQEKMKVLAAEVAVKQEQVAVLPQKELELAGNRETAGQVEQQLAEKGGALKELEAALSDLDAREKAITAITAEVQLLEGRVKDGGEKIATQKLRVDEARKARTVVEQSRKGKESYDQAELRLAELRAREQQRRAIEHEIASLEKEALRLSQAVGHEKVEIAQIGKQLAEEDAGLVKARTDLQVDDTLRQTAAALPELRSQLDQLKGERALLEGRRAGLVEGKEKLAAGSCPFFQEQCLYVADKSSKDLFSERIDDLDRAMATLDQQITAAAHKVSEAEQGGKELHGRKVRLQELDKQALALEARLRKNRERSDKLAVLKEQQTTAVSLVSARKTELQVFSGLDELIKSCEQERISFQAARDTFNAHLKDADDLENRSQTLAKWQTALEELHTARSGKQAELERCRAAYHSERHQELRGAKDRFLTEVATCRQQLAELERNRQRLTEEVASLKRLQEEINAKQAKIRNYEEKEKLVKFLRNQVFKNVSAQLSERFREEITLRADRIYRTISETDEELIWGEHYQIMLRDLADGVLRERSDDQLSGGQTMSAVVALRLALLQTIGARIAFFDEPTSNLDASRRENLAHAFRAIDVGREEVTEHWYDQLFLVSHDVAFTEITDQMLQIGEESLLVTDAG